MNPIKFCSQCGNKLSTQDKFCNSCGCKIFTAENAEIPDNPTENNMTTVTNAIPSIEPTDPIVKNKQGFLAKYFSFKGRINKRDYIIRSWHLIMIGFIIGIIALKLMFDSVLKAGNMQILINNIMIIVLAVFISAIPSLISPLSLQVRRCHDLDKSAWYILSPFSMSKLWYTSGTVGKNQYGIDPIDRNDPTAKGDAISGQEVAIGIISILACLGFVYWSVNNFLSQTMDLGYPRAAPYQTSYDTKNNQQTNKESSRNTNSSNNDNNSDKKEKASSSILKAQTVVNKTDIKGKVVATSYGHDSKGFVVLLNQNGQYGFYIFNGVDQQIAFVPFSQKMYHFYDTKKGGAYDKLAIFEIIMLNDKLDKDQKAGGWNGDDHIIPVYVFFETDTNGNIIPGMISTAESLKPSHYHAVLYEQKNVNTINLFLTEMKKLEENAQNRNTSLPNI